jgi:serine/threonine protein kinase
LNDFNQLRPLAKCSFGEIYVSTKKGSTENFAIKRIGKNYIDKQELTGCFEKKIEILKRLNHKNICRIYGANKTKENYFIFMEYINGSSLSECLEQHQFKYNAPFSESIVQHLMSQIIDALKYIHNLNIIHRNISLDSIMVHFKNDKDKKELNLLNATIKLIGFSYALNDVSGKTILGNPLNMPPILLLKLTNYIDKEIKYDNKIDIWSIGTVFYEMLTGKTLYNAQSLDDLARKAEIGFYTFPKKLSNEAYHFIKNMLRFSPEYRLSADKLANQPFLTTKNFNIININDIPKKSDDKLPNIENIKKELNFNEKDEILINTKEGQTQSQINSAPITTVKVTGIDNLHQSNGNNIKNINSKGITNYNIPQNTLSTVQNQNAGNIQPNTNGLDQNTGIIQPNTNGLNQNTGNIQPNTNGLNQNTGNIQPNTNGLNQNTGNIQPNTNGLNQNTGNIQPNNYGPYQYNYLNNGNQQANPYDRSFYNNMRTNSNLLYDTQNNLGQGIPVNQGENKTNNNNICNII